MMFSSLLSVVSQSPPSTDETTTSTLPAPSTTTTTVLDSSVELLGAVNASNSLLSGLLVVGIASLLLTVWMMARR